MERGWKVSGRGRPVEWSCAGSGGSTERGRGGNGQRRALEPQQASAVAAAACPGAVARCRDPPPQKVPARTGLHEVGSIQCCCVWAGFREHCGSLKITCTCARGLNVGAAYDGPRGSRWCLVSILNLGIHR